MLWFPLEQAVTIDKFGPCNPYSIETNPDTIFTIAPGTKNGEIFLGPLLLRVREFFSIVSRPPIPEPIETPILDESRESSSKPEFSIACFEATSPY